jgi:hypothetical protein
MERKARELIKTGKYREVHLDRGVEQILGKKFKVNRRPDIVAIRKNGKVDLFEVRSKTDVGRALRDRMQEVRRQLAGPQRGIYEVLEIAR